MIQLLLGGTGLVSSQAMLAQWRWVVVGATIAAAVLTPSTDPFTQTLLALPLVRPFDCAPCRLCNCWNHLRCRRRHGGGLMRWLGMGMVAAVPCWQMLITSSLMICHLFTHNNEQVGLYFGGAGAVRLLEQRRAATQQ